MALEDLPPRTLVAVAVVAGLAFQLIIGSAYVAAFLDPIPESSGVLVAVVNDDTGDAGAAFVTGLTNADSPVTFVVVPDRASALAGLQDKRYFGALLLPANLSEAIASLATTTPFPADVTAIQNAGAGTTGSLVAARVMELAVERFAATVRDQAFATFEPQPGVGAVTTAQARVIADPVRLRAETAHDVGPNGANGLAPVYLTMAAWLGGYFGAVALERFRDHVRLSAPRRAALVAGAAAGQAAVTTGVLGLIGLAMPDALQVAVFLALGAWVAYAVVGLILDLMGLAGVVPAFALMAFGLPASGGIYPVAMLPPAFAAVHAWSPFTWLVEAFRTVLYMPLAGDANTHAAMLVAVAVVATAASLAVARLKRTRSSGREGPSGPAFRST